MYNDFSFYGFPLVLDMYGVSIGIIFAPTLAAQGITPNRMCKGFTWVDAGTSIRRRLRQRRTAQGRWHSEPQAGLLQPQKMSGRKTLRERKAKSPYLGRGKKLFGKKQEKRREDNPPLIIIIIIEKHSCMHCTIYLSKPYFTTFLTVRSSGF